MQKKKFGKNMLARFDHYLRYLCLKRKWGWNEKAFFSEKKNFGVNFFSLSCEKQSPGNRV